MPSGDCSNVKIMAQKQHGTTRDVSPTTKSINASHAKYLKELDSGLYDKQLSFFDKNTGGYLLYSNQRKMDNMEYNAATFMAIKGKQITMTPEGVDGYELIIVNGKPRFGDGKIGITSYEQRSPKAANEATARKTVENAINHARKKGATIAVLFDYSRSFKIQDIKHGAEHFEKNYTDAKYQSVKSLIVVSGSGNVHEWELYKIEK